MGILSVNPLQDWKQIIGRDDFTYLSNNYTAVLGRFSRSVKQSNAERLYINTLNTFGKWQRKNARVQVLIQECVSALESLQEYSKISTDVRSRHAVKAPKKKFVNSIKKLAKIIRGSFDTKSKLGNKINFDIYQMLRFVVDNKVGMGSLYSCNNNFQRELNDVKERKGDILKLLTNAYVSRSSRNNIYLRSYPRAEPNTTKGIGSGKDRVRILCIQEGKKLILGHVCKNNKKAKSKYESIISGSDPHWFNERMWC